MLASEGVDNSLLRSGRTEFYREIHFEKYKKPHVIEYPKHAVVLNPQHTQNVKKVFASSSSSLGWEREDPLKRQHHVDEDDPQFMEPSLFICKDDELSRVMHLQWKEIGPVGLGLINMGNTCFANAVLQAIAYTPALAQYFAFQFRNPDARIGAPYDFAFALGETIRKLHLSRDKGKSNQGSFQSGAYKPALIMNQLRHLSSHFQLGKQCDAHEFAMQLLFAAQKSFLFHRVGTTKLPMHIATTTPLLRICGGFLRSQVSWNREDEIQQLLRKGKHQEAGDLRLEGNGRKGEKLFSNTYDPVTILSVELVGTSLENCLANFFKKEELDGRCYQSPRGVGVRAEKQFTFHVLPNVLIVQIKRFLSCGSKARKYIRYPLELDLQPYCSPTTREARSPQRYYLSAVCIHQGHTINCGHYYSVVKARNGTWYECDDSSVRLISEEKALNKEAYMLFYSKKDEEGHINDPKTSKRCLNELHPPQRLSHPSPKRLSPPEISSRSQVFDYPSSDLHSTYPFVHDLSNLSNALYTDEKELGKVISEEELAVLKKKRSSKHSKEHCEEEAQPHLSFEQHEHPSSYFSGSKVSVEERPYLPLLHQDGSKDEEAQHNQMEENFCTVGKKMTKKLLGSQSLIVKKISHDPVKKGSKVYNGESFRPREITAVHRDSALPKFQQKIRDPLWEISMDQGRVKKIKSHRLNELEDGQLGQKRNPFQEETEKRFKRKYEANK